MAIADRVPRFHPQVAMSVIGGEAVLVLPQDGQIEVLNEVGARVLQLVDGKRTITDIAAVIVREYEVEVEQATQDVAQLVQGLVGDGALVLTGDPGEP